MKQTPDQYASLGVNVETPAQEAAEQSVDSQVATRRYAVLVCHGMGQQVRFETLDSVARAVHTIAVECGTAKKKQRLDVSLHPDDGQFLGRAELALTLSDGEKIDVHFYEAYWAPLTEGRVTLGETLSVFLGAGLRGLRFAYADGVFDRWMFGGRQEFEIPVRRILQLGLGLWMLMLLTASFAAAGLAPTAKLLEMFRGGDADPQVALFVASAFSIGLLLIVLGIVSVLFAAFIENGPDIEQPRSEVNGELRKMAPSWTKRHLMAAFVAMLVLGSSWATLAFGKFIHGRWLLSAAIDPGAHLDVVVLGTSIFVVEAILLLLVVRGFLIQFAGDVAAYVSAYKVSKFHEIRREIQDRGKRVARFIYEAKTEDGKERLYEKVAVVGHSLGAVLAYDTLNDAINRDGHAGGWDKDIPALAFDVVKRTHLLLTFGSPLDKTAFVFRTQKTESEIDVREALAAATQPMIVSYSNRPRRWINLWSAFDWVSGPLGYYDAPGRPELDRVINIQARGNISPAKAHTEYWRKPLLPAVLHAAITNVCPKSISEPARSQILGAFDGG